MPREYNRQAARDLPIARNRVLSVQAVIKEAWERIEHCRATLQQIDDSLNRFNKERGAASQPSSQTKLRSVG